MRASVNPVPGRQSLHHLKAGTSLLAFSLFVAAQPAAYAQSGADPKEAPTPPPLAPEKPVFDAESSADDIFKTVFGNARPIVSPGDYAVQIENIYIGDFPIRPAAGGTGSVSARFVEITLAPILTADLEARAIALAKGRDFVTFEELRELGLDVSFEDTQLLLKIGIPGNLRDVSDLYIRSARKNGEVERVPQSPVSAYLSARLGVTYVEDSPGGVDEGLYRTAADIDFAANFLGLVAEAQFRYDDRSTRTFRRGDVRLSYDDRNTLIRYELGDLTVGKRPFQLAPRIAGVSAYRQYSINPYLNIRPVSEQAFELERPARVEVLVNGVPSRTYNLNSGRYRLRDFPLVSSAANDIELVITYDSGQTERLSFPAFFDIDLLNPGLFDFAVNAGVPFRERDGLRVYDTHNYNLSAYGRYGVSPSLTVGANFEGDRYFSNVGAEILWATGLGTFAVNATTDARNIGLGASRMSIQYRWRDADPSRERMVDGVLIMSGKDYRSLNSILGGELLSTQARVRVSQKVSDRGRAQVYGSYERYRGVGEGYSVGAAYTHQMRFGSVAASVEYRNTPDDRGIGVNLGITIPFGRSSVTATFDSKDNSARAFYANNGSNGIGSISTSAGIERRDGSDRQSGRISYIGNRFEASFEQIARDYFSDRGTRDLRSEFTVGSAIVMADGHFGLSRPVTNSFAIFDADKAAGGHQLKIEPRSGFGSAETTYSAESGALGPSVLSTLTPYFNRAIQVDSPDAPAGSSLGGQVFVLNPGYRSGTYVKIGSNRNVSIVGNLADRDGDPLGYASGEAFLVGGDDDGKAAKAKPSTYVSPDAPIPLFSNASGRFFIEGVQAGKSYRIELDIDGKSVLRTIDVPKDADGMFRLEAPLSFDVDVSPPSEGEAK